MSDELTERYGTLATYQLPGSLGRLRYIVYSFFVPPFVLLQ